MRLFIIFLMVTFIYKKTIAISTEKVADNPTTINSEAVDKLFAEDEPESVTKSKLDTNRTIKSDDTSTKISPEEQISREE